MSLQLRELVPSDLKFALHLSGTAGWNQTELDWRRFLEIEPRGCFLALWDGAACGTATTIRHGPHLGWISMVLVAEGLRGRGIGKALLKHCIEYLHSAGACCIRLDATQLGRPLYSKLGFVDEFGLVRLRGPKIHGRCPDVEAMRPEDLPAVCEHDRTRFGEDRSKLIRTYTPFADGAFGIVRGKGAGCPVNGYCLTRPGISCVHIGPVVADTQALGQQLLSFATRNAADSEFFVDALADDAQTIDFLKSHGYVARRTFTRMRLGQCTEPPCHGAIVAIAGPEYG